MRKDRVRAARATGVVLLVLPLAGLAWVPLYAREDPELAGVPFFYWYQLAWVALSLVCLCGAAVLIPAPDSRTESPPDSRPDHPRPDRPDRPGGPS